jgi:plastocyanin
MFATIDPAAKLLVALRAAPRMRWSFFVLLMVCLAGRVFAANIHGVTVAGHRPVANAVVWLDAPGQSRSGPPSKVVLDQRNLRFVPHVLAIRVGTTVDFPNHDRVFHNVFSFKDGKVFDLGLYPVGATRAVIFDKPGLSRIYCNIHPGMAAYVMAVDSAYFALSNSSGSFTLLDVPPGRYTYHAWRAGADPVSGTWSADASSPLTIEWP